MFGNAQSRCCPIGGRGVDAVVPRVLARPYRTRWIRLSVEPEVPLPLLAVNGFWMPSFALFGLCGARHEQSRLTEIVSLIQTTAASALVLVLVTCFDDPMS
jgi:hypothetical protein